MVSSRWSLWTWLRTEYESYEGREGERRRNSWVHRSAAFVCCLDSNQHTAVTPSLRQSFLSIVFLPASLDFVPQLPIKILLSISSLIHESSRERDPSSRPLSCSDKHPSRMKVIRETRANERDSNEVVT